MGAAPPLDQRGGVWRFASPAAENDIAALRAGAPEGIPDSYFDFLRTTNGGEGDLAVEPGWFAPWPAEEVLQCNRGYRVAASVPGLFGFGSNGGGELIAFDFRAAGCVRIVMLPFMPMDLEEAVVISESFDQCALCIGIPMAYGT
jgi:hypothetical protein